MDKTFWDDFYNPVLCWFMEFVDRKTVELFKLLLLLAPLAFDLSCGQSWLLKDVLRFFTFIYPMGTAAQQQAAGTFYDITASYFIPPKLILSL